MAKPNSGSDQQRPLDPGPEVWDRLGVVPGPELHAGFQSRVFRATGASGSLVVKLIESGHDNHVVPRTELVCRLAEINRAVVGPIPLQSKLVTEIDAWHAVCYPYIEGPSPDTGNRQDVEAMAATLASLHDSLSTLDAELPPVVALRDAGIGEPVQGQIIHGDYGASNLIAGPAGLRVIDLDDCGWGSIEFEIGNSLYLALFDSWNSGDLDRYDRFRLWFVDRYRGIASTPIDEGRVDRAIQTRVGALRRWLVNPAEAPIGIQTSSEEWQRRLHSFVSDVSDTA